MTLTCEDQEKIKLELLDKQKMLALNTTVQVVNDLRGVVLSQYGPLESYYYGPRSFSIITSSGNLCNEILSGSTMHVLCIQL